MANDGHGCTTILEYSINLYNLLVTFVTKITDPWKWAIMATQMADTCTSNWKVSAIYSYLLATCVTKVTHTCKKGDFRNTNGKCM